MRNYRDSIDKYLSRCLYCEAWPVINSMGFCETCALILDYNRSYRRPRYGNLMVTSLYSLGNDLVQTLVISAKGNHRRRFWQDMASRVLNHRLHQRPNLSVYSNIVFSCAPTREHPRDQAERLLSEIVMYFPSARTIKLIRSETDDTAQKDKSKTDRENVRFRVEDDFISDMDTLHVFVDDVITTGATARAAKRAMGNPENFEVWTICYRPLLQAMGGVI